ncbi:nitrilase-related carbon-nitrogen hydrolase [Desulfurobacterium atlanticum]|uniref:Predicted amidohydrolase n=1 Tax=Desulfurobacterium atlanticum TaxID=240169 RepID=A0A239AC97_9BACT|nr:nitrilase-related carbon-nitrogen hydrolase [Desulfurobacterium atlanticum]SNR93257.1 Predicted amidohydrolase [Desulfurobacterium atlanticum]
MKVSVIQFNTEAGEFNRNWNRSLTFLNFCDDNSIVVFPEVFSTEFAYDCMDEAAKFGLTVLDFLIKLSESSGSVFVFTVIEKGLNGFYNVVKVIDCGKEVLSRPKIKLFKPFEEDKYFKSGKFPDDLKVVETSKGIIAPLICFELRFSEFFLHFLKENVQIVTISAQWGRARKKHWEILLRARAIENQVFVVGANGTGDMAGSSAIIDPWGRVLGDMGDGEGVISADISLSVIEQVRRKLPMER